MTSYTYLLVVVFFVLMLASGSVTFLGNPGSWAILGLGVLIFRRKIKMPR